MNSATQSQPAVKAAKPEKTTIRVALRNSYFKHLIREHARLAKPLAEKIVEHAGQFMVVGPTEAKQIFADAVKVGYADTKEKPPYRQDARNVCRRLDEVFSLGLEDRIAKAA